MRVPRPECASQSYTCYAGVQVRDVGLIALAETCSGLTSLGLHCCRRLTDASMAVVAANLHQLTSLNVSGCLPMSCSAVQVGVPTVLPGMAETCREGMRPLGEGDMHVLHAT